MFTFFTSDGIVMHTLDVSFQTVVPGERLATNTALEFLSSFVNEDNMRL